MSYLDINGLRVFWTKIKSWVTNQGYGTYSKPQQGIPKTDLANSVQTSLNKADSALQTAPVTSVNSKTGAVSLTASDVGLGNVGNFKAVSTQSNQGLTTTEKENARTNIGAGTSSFSGNYADLSNKPTIPTKVSQLTNDSGYTTNTGTITGITMNGDVKGTSGVVNLGVVLTEHQDISGKADVSHTHKYAGSSSVGGSANSAVKLDTSAGDSNTPVYFSGGKPVVCTSLDLDTSGNAATATKLKTARTIGLNTGATGTATNFDGSGNIAIPVTSVKEAYLSWGGKNFSGAYGPIDAAMVPDLGANRLAFMPAAGVEVQYSRDGGSTWSTYSTSEADKINLFNGNGSGHIIGASTATGIDKSKYQLRITITTNTANVYTALNKFVIYCSTNGSSGSWCTIDGKTKANVDSGTNTWVTFANKVSLSGWSGYNVINTSDITTYGNTSHQYQKLRFTFGVTSHPSSSSYGGLIIYKIMGFGGMGWTIPSTMAATGRMYTYDASQNVTFPAAVSATALYSNSTKVSVEGHTHTATNLGIADYVVEQGEANNKWKYRKWNSGRLEYFCTRMFLLASAGGAVGNLYRGQININLPAMFNSPPWHVHFAPVDSARNIVSMNGYAIDSTRINLYIWTATSADIEAYVSCYMIGTWK